MQEGEPKNGYREQEAAGGTYAPKKVPELELSNFIYFYFHQKS